MRDSRFVRVRVSVCVCVVLAIAVAGLAPLPSTAAGVEAVPRAAPGAAALPDALRQRLADELAKRGPDYRPRTRNLRDDGSPRYTNRLLLEASPYLQQHAHNPVDWYPWGDEAFEAARASNRPVLVSIGYSTCHWCHVMEEESFDDPDTARILNANFIAIKVDREARPDVDAIYMTALHAMGERGGWPLNVFLTPDRQPFFGGTYFPPEDTGNRRSFTGVLRILDERWKSQPAEILDVSGRLTQAIRKGLEGAAATSSQVPGPQVLVDTLSAVVERADRRWGGLGTRTKFPATFPIRAMLRYHRRTGDPEALELTLLTLEKMAAGGLRDHVGGGFHRYTTEPRWLVPHFEKMLYDNALLAVAYLEAWQLTGREDFALVTRSILDYVEREMTSPEGGFYSATDADSTGPDGEMEEGRFFTWTPGEIEAALDPAAAKAVIAYYGVSERGDLEGRSILRSWRPLDEVASELGVKPAALERTLARARATLYEVRGRRPAPLRDEKILVAWNGLMISAFARAGFALAEPGYVDAARRAADLVLAKMRRQGRLIRVYQGGRADGPAFLEDYAFLIAALLDLYEVAPDPRWIREAVALQAQLDRHYADDAGGGYYRTADDHEALIAREKPSRDDAIPSGNSVQALNLLRLREYTLDDEYRTKASLLFSAFHERLVSQPLALSEMLLALDFQLDSIKEVVVVRPEGDDGGAMLAPIRPAFVPNRILSVVTQGADLDAHAELVPLVKGKRARLGKVTAYVCADRVCLMPTEDPQVFAQLMGDVTPLAIEAGEGVE